MLIEYNHEYPNVLMKNHHAIGVIRDDINDRSVIIRQSVCSLTVTRRNLQL